MHSFAQSHGYSEPLWKSSTAPSASLVPVGELFLSPAAVEAILPTITGVTIYFSNGTLVTSPQAYDKVVASLEKHLKFLSKIGQAGAFNFHAIVAITPVTALETSILLTSTQQFRIDKPLREVIDSIATTVQKSGR